jgi:hypothetical protein
MLPEQVNHPNPGEKKCDCDSSEDPQVCRCHLGNSIGKRVFMACNRGSCQEEQSVKPDHRAGGVIENFRVFF